MLLLGSKNLNKLYLLFFLFICFHCKNEDSNKNKTNYSLNEVKITEGGKIIEFPKNSSQLNLFETMKVSNLQFDLNINAPATVIGRVKKSEANSYSSIILFDSPELTSYYTNYQQNLSLIQIAQKNFNRTKDLFEHGAATGKELSEAQSELLSKQASLSEYEAKLRRDGFNPKTMSKAKPGTVWLISDLPETELNILLEGTLCKLIFPSFPSEVFSGKIDAIAEVLNSETRKARIRILMEDQKDKIRPGMYGKVQFIMPENGLMIPKKSLLSSNSKFYIFIKTSETIFERREVIISTENEGFIEIALGVIEGEEVVTTNVFLLKGLSFGI
jgi:multidrug efflux pump subunit AcrA (membrane-fusion protein)